MISLEFDNLEDSRTFCESTKIFRLAVSLGGAESLIEHVTSMTHGSWTGAVGFSVIKQQELSSL